MSPPQRKFSEINLEVGDKPPPAPLRRIAGSIPTAAWFIVVTELCERFAYFGGTQIFQNYIQFPRWEGSHDDPTMQTGALGQGQAAATALNQFFTFFCYVTPLLGALVADQYLGKFRTIVLFSTLYLSGWILVTLTSLPASLAAGAGFPGLIIGMVIIGIGTGGIKSIIAPMAADQYGEQVDEERLLPSGETVIVDADLSIQHLYNWFYWAINVGALAGGIICPKVEQWYDFWVAFLLPCCIFSLCISIFIFGRRYYIRKPPQGSIMLKAIKCIGAGLKPVEALSAPRQAALKPELRWSPTFIIELKQALRACKVFIPMCIYWVSYSQVNTNLISQAATMDRPASIPNDIMSNIDPLTLLILIPFMDLVVFPGIARTGFNFTAIRRMTTGFVLGSLAMLWTAYIQYSIDTSPAKSINVWWQIPSYFFIAFSEVFASIGGLEYAYTHAPASMKSLCSAISLFPNAAAAVIGLAISPLAQPATLMYMYLGIAAATFITAIIFFISFRHYDALDAEDRVAMATEKDTGSTTLARPIPQTWQEKADDELRAAQAIQRVANDYAKAPISHEHVYIVGDTRPKSAGSKGKAKGSYGAI